MSAIPKPTPTWVLKGTTTSSSTIPKASIVPTITPTSTVSVPTVVQLTQSITQPVTTQNIQINRDTRELEWLQGLQSFIYNSLLSLTGTTLEDRRLLVDAESMAIWKVAFTHISYDRNPQNNYEVLENLGDSVMDLAFASYTSQKFPDIDVSRKNNLKVIYLAKPEQSKLSFQYGLTKWVRSNVDINIHVAEDILESFFGALFEVGDMKLGPGTGYVISFNVLNNILKPLNITMVQATVHPKTQLSEIFAKMQWGKLDDIMEEYPPSVDHGYIITITLSEKAKNDLRELGMSVPNVLASGEGQYFELLKDEINAKAIQVLASYGITWDWANKISEIKNTRSGDLAPYYASANAKAMKEGYVKIFFPKIQKKIISKRLGARSFLQLVGEKPDGHLVNLATVEGAKEVDQLKIDAYKQYISLN